MGSYHDIKKTVSILMIIIFAATSFSWTSARASMIPTGQMIEGSRHQQNRDRLRGLFDRPLVKAQLEQWGLDHEAAKDRVESLTDREIADILERLDQLPSGGSALGAILGTALLVFVILLVTDILGLTDVFPFVKKHR